MTTGRTQTEGAVQNNKFKINRNFQGIFWNLKILRQIARVHFVQIRLDVQHELSNDEHSPEISFGKLKMDWWYFSSSIKKKKKRQWQSEYVRYQISKHLNRKMSINTTSNTSSLRLRKSLNPISLIAKLPVSRKRL